MFSQASVILFTGGAYVAGGMRGGGHAWQGVCVAKGGHAWWWVCMVEGVHGRGRHVWQRGGMHGGGCAWWRVYMAGGGMCGWEEACVAGETATATDGTHPAGMFSC